MQWNFNMYQLGGYLTSIKIEWIHVHVMMNIILLWVFFIEVLYNHESYMYSVHFVRVQVMYFVHKFVI